MKRSVLWDSSAILALVDSDDRDHRGAVEAWRWLVRQKRPSFITNYIEVEAHALLLRRTGRIVARQWLLEGGLPVLRATTRDEERGRQIIATYADKDWSFCDAISFAMMELRGVGTAFTFDKHFRQFGRFEVIGLAG